MGMLTYSVKTSVFEGPLDLLLELIEKRKLFVNDVSLTQVTDDFIRHIEAHDEFPIGESAEFIVIASTLMLVKSRSLLPSLTLTDEEEASIDDLQKRLLLYARTKELASIIKRRFGKEIIYEKLPSKRTIVTFSPDKDTNTATLWNVLERVIEAIPKKEIVPKAVVKKMITLEETIERLAERISKSTKMNFKEFYGNDLGAQGTMTHEKKVMIIVGFLAMLELVKRGAIRVTQEGRGDIEIETGDVGVPQYV